MPKERTTALDLYERQLRHWEIALPKESRIEFGLCIDRMMMAVDAQIDAVRGAAGEWSRNAEHIHAAKAAAGIKD